MNKEMFPVKRESISSMEEGLFSDKEKLAKAYVHDLLNFSKALHCLHEEGLLPEQILHTKEHYGESLESATFMNDKDWEYLTMISLYSPGLATHSIETYRLIRSRIERMHIGSETIAELIEKEVGSLDQFYRASLLHDIGKLNIPESVMNHEVRPGDWHGLMYASSNPAHVHTVYSDTGELVPVTELDVVTFMSDYDMHKSSNVPARPSLSEGEIAALERRGISPDLTFREIWGQHEEGTRKILEGEGLHTEAEIAGQHHSYNKEGEDPTPISSQTIDVSADKAGIELVRKIILSIGDTQQALRSDRPYNKKAFTPLTTASILMRDAEKVPLSKRITALWIQEDLKEIEETSLSEEDISTLEELKAFVNNNLPS